MLCVIVNIKKSVLLAITYIRAQKKT